MSLIFTRTQSNSNQSLCAHLPKWRHCHLFLFLFWSGVKDIMAPVTQLPKVMPCSTQQNQCGSVLWFIWGWVHETGCGYVRKKVPLRSLPPLRPPTVHTHTHTHAEKLSHTEQWQNVAHSNILLHLLCFPLFLYASWFSGTDPGSHTLHPVLHWHIITNTHTHTHGLHTSVLIHNPGI